MSMNNMGLKDAQEVAAALARNGFDVTLCTDLTKEAFNKVFTEFAVGKGCQVDCRLFVYYAGHGYTETMTNGEELGYIVMVDAPLPEKDKIGFTMKSVDMQAIVTQAKMIKSRHVMFMFDSCFAGTILNLRANVVPQSISDNIQYPVRQFITAGRANEPVPDHSFFKQCFLDLIEGRDKEPIPDGYITGDELGLYLKDKVAEYNPGQHPQCGKISDPKLDKGDFVFIKGLNAGTGKVTIYAQPTPPAAVPDPTPAVRTMTEPRPATLRIEGKVTAVKTDAGTGAVRMVVLNVGSDAGVRRGRVFVISRDTRMLCVALIDKVFTDKAEASVLPGSHIRDKDGNPVEVKVNDSAATVQESNPLESAPGAPGGMVLVEGGTFNMGFELDESSRPVHPVNLNSFWIGMTEVTYAEYDVFCDAVGKNRPDDGGFGRGARPASLSWFSAVAYCNWRSQKEGLEPCYAIEGENVICDFKVNGYRLPTEAEWEYAARGGNKSRGCTFSGSNDGNEVGWHDNNSGLQTNPVGFKKPNELGLLDMSGNVYEWCWDWLDRYSADPQDNPVGPATGDSRVLRGGGFSTPITGMSCTSRIGVLPIFPNIGYGFRLARTVTK